jgi:poly(3-hydroxybutyrate) depolymerase
VNDLNALGLVDDVVARLNRLPAADRAIYVTGHSRGGALVGVSVACVVCLPAAPNIQSSKRSKCDCCDSAGARVGGACIASLQQILVRIWPTAC